MSIGPTSPRAKRGFEPDPYTSAKKEESIERPWTFLRGLTAQIVRVTGLGFASGKMLTIGGRSGEIVATETLPSTTLARTGGTITETATLVVSASGEYIISTYIQCTTAGTAGTLDVTFSYTDDIGAVTTPIVATIALNATNRDEATTILRCSGGGIDYTFTVTGAAGSPVYSVHLAVTKVR